jgi:hypothetical protein
MVRVVWVLACFVVLAGCSRRPDVERSIAECQLDAARLTGKDDVRQADPGYIEACMRSKGYVYEGLAETCQNAGFPFTMRECYRPD